jgi:SagB-type dehydrogenase family enzyme
MDTITLPPIQIGGPALTTVLGTRRSRREYSGEPLSPEQLALLLWAAHGVTSDDGRRTAPSAGFTDPMTVTAVTPAWFGTYRGDHHDVEVTARTDVRSQLAAACGDQEAVARAGLTVVASARVARTAAKYGERAELYVKLEAGHIGQNVLLAAESLGLPAVPVGAFREDAICEVLRLGADELPLYLIPVGRPNE